MRAMYLCVFLLLSSLCGCGTRDFPGTEPGPAVLIEVPQTRQATPYTCGVAVLQSLLAHNGFLYRQDVLEERVGATPERGTSPEAMMECMREHGIAAEIEENMSMARLRGHIAAGRPVVCFLQAWNDDPAFDYSAGWEDGHYAIAVGYDGGRIYFMDPSTLGNYAYVDNDKLPARWHDGDENGQVHRAGIVVTNPNPVYRRNAFSPIL